MTAKTQFDVHPDAESLNAFAEQALAERERGQIVAHLAGCSRCRQVVFLAQEAAEEMEPVVMAPRVRVPVRRASWFGEWFRTWWFAWTPVAALTAMVAVAVYVHVRRAEIASSQMAKVEMQTPAQNGGGNPGPAARPAEIPRAAAPAATAPKRAVPAAELPPPPAAPELKEAKPNAEPPHAPLFAFAEPPAPGAAGSGTPATDAGAEHKPAAEMAEMHEERERAGTAAQIHGQGEAGGVRPEARSSGTEKSEPSDAMLTAGAPAPPLDAVTAPSALYEAHASHGEGRAVAAYKALRIELPSGLPAVSKVTDRHRTLALDPEGAVFLSEDSGGQWESVAKQWTGRAVAVRVKPAADGQNGAAAVPDTIFELVNDRGLVWVSTDGRKWTAK